MKQITLRRRVYGTYKGRLLKSLQSEVSQLIANLDSQLLSISTSSKGNVIIRIEGDDEEFVYNLLAKEYGTGFAFGDLVIGQDYWGQITSVGRVGYGLYVDIGLTGPESKDVLVPLHRLRDQTRMKGQSLRTITKSLLFVDSLPITIRLVNVDVAQKKLEGELAPSLIKRTWEWGVDDHERLLVFGANRRMIETALEKSDHSTDIFRIEELGAYEFSLVCKRTTRASGIVSAIGPRLKGVPMHLLIPGELKVSGLAEV